MKKFLLSLTFALVLGVNGIAPANAAPVSRSVSWYVDQTRDTPNTSVCTRWDDGTYIATYNARFPRREAYMGQHDTLEANRQSGLATRTAAFKAKARTCEAEPPTFGIRVNKN